MDITETEYDIRRRLENEKLQLEIDNLKRKKPKGVKIANYIQPWLPTFFTVISIALTYQILNRTKFFENANILYEYKNARLKDEEERLQKDSARLVTRITLQRDTITKQHSDSIRLSNQINDYKNSITPMQKQISALIIDRDRLLGNNMSWGLHLAEWQTARAYFTQEIKRLTDENNKLKKRIIISTDSLHKKP